MVVDTGVRVLVHRAAYDGSMVGIDMGEEEVGRANGSVQWLLIRGHWFWCTGRRAMVLWWELMQVRKR